MHKKISLSLIISSVCFALVLGLFPVKSLAQGCDGQENAGDILGLDCAGTQYSGLSSEDPRIVTIRIVNFALSLLGIVAVCIILYAGFTWMTAGGNDEKVGSAKKILTAAVMGLVIIMASYSIMSFVLRSLCETIGGACGNGYSSSGSSGFSPPN
ncbi:MAG TPA: hypothetical protein PK295_02360 [Candidatus Magasanikbacteria bacterium]|nr:hypothetical protein [Candidatus Magasanikbacteria bacterium]